ncbi:MAG: hypothetical protein DDT22_00855 [candidate division WS2 bacterium]|nr:hypothetical protein [Candidatus Lithacetigena glycinireducens]
MEIRELAETTEKEMGRGFAWLKKKPLLAVGVLAVAGGIIFLFTRRGTAKPEMVGFAGYPQAPEVRYSQTPEVRERETHFFDERLRDLTEKIGRMGELQTEKIGRMKELQLEATRQAQHQFAEQQIRFEQNLFRTITQAMRDHTPIQPPTVSEPRPAPTTPMFHVKQFSEPTPLPLPQYFSIPVTAVVGGTGGGLFIGERQAVKEFIETGGGGREVGVGHWSVDYRNWYPANARPSSEVRQIVTGLAGKSQAEKLRILREEGLIRY